MNVYRDLNLLPKFTKAVITTGSFDGVHNGHVQIIKQLLKEAKEIDGTPVLITFYPHPKQVVKMKDNVLNILNTPEEKYNLLQENGIENIVVVPFDTSFAALSASDYISKFLVLKFHPSIIVLGYDHRFGNNREGDFNLLKSKEAAFNYTVKEIPKLVEKNITISSTKIRTALLLGDIETANTLLNYKYFFSGKVIEGNKLGRTIGYPTANIKIDDELKLIPANGVYAVTIKLHNRLLKGMMNIGFRPTVQGTTRTIEVNILDFDENIYTEKITITVVKKLRDEIKFNGLEELKKQLSKDKIMALSILKDI